MEMNVEKTKVMRISRETSLLQVMIDQKHLENGDYFKHLGSLINDGRCMQEIKSRFVTAKEFNRKKAISTSKLVSY
jgi:hypothetical protein